MTNSQKPPGVAFYGKVRIPTIGHAKAIDTAKGIAKKTGGQLHIGLSGTSQPLTLDTKKAHAEMIFGHPVETGTPETSNLFSYLSHLGQHHDELHLVAGSDRAPEYRKTLQQWNGRPDKNGKVAFNFKKWKVHEVEGKREESSKPPTQMSRPELESSVSATKLEGLARGGDYEGFKAYHPGLPEKHVKKVYNQIRMSSTEAPKPVSIKKIRAKLKEDHVEDIGDLNHEKFGPMLDTFTQFASKKLGIKSLPNMRLEKEPMSSSFGGYNPGEKSIVVISKNRHPMDVFRTVAHELVHHKQNEDGRLGKDISKEGSTGSDIENEANSEAGKIMRWFAKSNPQMFKSGYVTETTNSAAIGNGIRGLGNISGDPAVPGTAIDDDELSPYHQQNIQDTQDMQNKLSGYAALSPYNSVFTYDSDYFLDGKDAENYKTAGLNIKLSGKNTLKEGINDPGTFKAVFLAGGPGSGKDYVMKQTLDGMGLQEINSDVAFEFLMRKAGLNFKMPESERVERDLVRGRGKNITKEQQRLALAGRRGVIINGTADDPEKMASIKKELEDLGYSTMMVFVNTSDKVSKERNIGRGDAGGRAVPEDIRKDKWEACQAAMPVLQKLFGKDNFVAIDNSNDLRTAPPEVKKKVEGEFQNIFKMTKKFVARQPNDNPAAAEWNQSEMQRRNMQSFVPPSTTAFGTGSVQRGAVQASDAIPADQDNVQQVSQAPTPDEQSQASRLGLTYYGFGRYGAMIKGKNTVTYITQNGKLVPKPQQVAEEKKMKGPDPCWKGYQMVGKKKKNGKEVPNCVPVDEAFEDMVNENTPSDREWGKPSLTKIYKEGTPGQTFPSNPLFEKMKEKMKKKKKLAQEDNAPALGYEFGRDGIGPTFGVIRSPSGFGGYSLPMSESVAAWASKDETIERFITKYGEHAEQKLYEACERLSKIKSTPNTAKSFNGLRESWEAIGGRDMGSVLKTDKDEVDEQSVVGAYVPKRNEIRSNMDFKNSSDLAQIERSRTLKHAHAKKYESRHSINKMVGPHVSTEPRASKLKEESPAWQRKEGKNPKGGLNQKGVDAYNRENPGHHLQTAVTTKPSKLKPGSKAANRRKSFCARMGGMPGPMKDEKGRPTRKALSLRKWNCEE